MAQRDLISDKIELISFHGYKSIFSGTSYCHYSILQNSVGRTSIPIRRYLVTNSQQENVTSIPRKLSIQKNKRVKTVVIYNKLKAKVPLHIIIFKFNN